MLLLRVAKGQEDSKRENCNRAHVGTVLFDHTFNILFFMNCLFVCLFLCPVPICSFFRVVISRGKEERFLKE